MANDFTFDTSAALIGEIGAGILASPGFADDGWTAIALVAQIEGALAFHGFRYYADGEAKPASDISFETALQFVTLADQMEGLNRKRWKTCLVQIRKPEMKIRLTYEYDDINRWMVTPANIDAMRETLRPE